MEKPTARQRSTFGAFQMGQSHIKSDIAQVVKRPSALRMAEMLREGLPPQEVAEANGITVGTLRRRMNEAGFRSNGQVKAAKK